MPEQEQISVDTGFTTMVDRVSPANLQDSEVSDAENVRFREGVAETRKGVVKPGCYNNIAPEFSNEINPWGEIHGIGTFSDVDGTQFLIIAADGKVYFSRQGINPVEILIDATGITNGLTLSGTVEFTQAFGKLLMHRGKYNKPLVMSDLDDGFTDVVPVWDSTKVYASGERISYGPLFTASSITSSGTTATVTFSSSTGWRTGQEIFITGCDQSEYNGRFVLTESAITENAYNYTMASDPSVDTATGTIIGSAHLNFYEANQSTSAGQSPVTHSAKWDQKYDAMPNSSSGVYIQSRLAAPTSYDVTTGTYDQREQVVQFSDVLDITKSYFTQGFSMDKGAHASIVGLHVMSENQLLIFMDNKVHVMAGVRVESVNATFSDNVVLETLIPHYGLAAPRAKATAGDDVYFFSSKRGIVSLKRNLQGKAQGVDIPLSSPIQKIIDSISQRHYGKIRMAYWENALYVAVCRDSTSEENDTILCYDFLGSSWSYYTGDAIKPKEFFISQWTGRERLFFAGSDGFINLVDEAWADDQIRDTDKVQNLKSEPIAFNLTTRGYVANDIDHRLFETLSMSVSTWSPKFTIKIKGEGVGESQTLCTDRTKSRITYYRPFDAAPYDVSNRDQDHGTPYREDYSILAPNDVDAYIQLENGDYMHSENGFQIGFENWAPALSVGSAIVVDRMQETTETFRFTPKRGRYVQVNVSNTQGKIKINKLALTSRASGRISEIQN
jgi:hypothetical protein